MSESQRKVRRAEEAQEPQALDAGDEDVRMRTHAGHGDDMPNLADRGRAVVITPDIRDSPFRGWRTRFQPLIIIVDPEETGTLSRPQASPLEGWVEAPAHWRVRIDNRHLPQGLIEHVEGQEREGRNLHRSFLYSASGILFRVRFNKRNEVTISLRSPK
ncbi:GL13415 [Drosophila persimilis]|uniref:GL13415 n=1 Tax=Drosophila persimilis TaxID=7234 RepID=B4H3B0_DROPE|nr:GL13415 [Drosophila persimilis]